MNMSYAAANISVRRGLRHSSAASATLVSLIVHTVVLGSAVVLTGGAPRVAATAVGLIAITGVLQTGMRLLHYTGIDKVGTSRAVTLRSTHPIVSVLIGITVLQEQTTPAILAVFFVSGLLHELVISFPAGGGWGLPTLYFVLHGGLVWLERHGVLRPRRWLTILFVLLPLPLLARRRVDLGRPLARLRLVRQPPCGVACKLNSITLG